MSQIGNLAQIRGHASFLESRPFLMGGRIASQKQNGFYHLINFPTKICLSLAIRTPPTRWIFRVPMASKDPTPNADSENPLEVVEVASNCNYG